FRLEVAACARQFLLKAGTSEEYGARELKRTILRELTQPLAAMVAGGRIEPGDVVHAELATGGEGLAVVVACDKGSEWGGRRRLPRAPQRHQDSGDCFSLVITHDARHVGGIRRKEDVERAAGSPCQV